MQKMIEVRDLCHTYLARTPYEKKALQNISFSLNKGECLGIIGSNGSGKSTLVQHLNGVLETTEGSIVINGKDAADPETRNCLWQQVGLVFQYPEQQLFEASVFDDVAYGPRNLGLPPDEVATRTLNSLRQVGLEPEEVQHLSPAALSGGMRRRVAIAGILAIRPQVLILDEPTAGLDPLGRRTILNLIAQLQREQNITIILISHSLREIITLANKLAVLDQGSLKLFGETADIIADQQFLADYKYMLPEHLKLIQMLLESGKEINSNVRSLSEAEAEIDRLLKEKDND